MKETMWCKNCGCYKDNKVICSSGRHSYTATRDEINKNFPFPIIVSHDGHIIQDGKSIS
jgi:hypothetical protein